MQVPQTCVLPLELPPQNGALRVTRKPNLLVTNQRLYHLSYECEQIQTTTNHFDLSSKIMEPVVRFELNCLSHTKGIHILMCLTGETGAPARNRTEEIPTYGVGAVPSEPQVRLSIFWTNWSDRPATIWQPSRWQRNVLPIELRSRIWHRRAESNCSLEASKTSVLPLNDSGIVRRASVVVGTPYGSHSSTSTPTAAKSIFQDYRCGRYPAFAAVLKRTHTSDLAGKAGNDPATFRVRAECSAN